MRTVLKTLRRQAMPALIADVAGVTALSIILFGVLHLPASI